MVSGPAPRRGGSECRTASICEQEATWIEGTQCRGKGGEGGCGSWRGVPPNSVHQCCAQRCS
eukprot:7537600-Prorocentrum_lima.AAC.1